MKMLQLAIVHRTGTSLKARSKRLKMPALRLSHHGFNNGAPTRRLRPSVHGNRRHRHSRGLSAETLGPCCIRPCTCRPASRERQGACSMDKHGHGTYRAQRQSRGRSRAKSYPKTWGSQAQLSMSSYFAIMTRQTDRRWTCNKQKRSPGASSVRVATGSAPVQLTISPRRQAGNPPLSLSLSLSLCLSLSYTHTHTARPFGRHEGTRAHAGSQDAGRDLPFESFGRCRTAVGVTLLGRPAIACAGLVSSDLAQPLPRTPVRACGRSASDSATGDGLSWRAPDGRGTRGAGAAGARCISDAPADGAPFEARADLQTSMPDSKLGEHRRRCRWLEGRAKRHSYSAFAGNCV